MYGNFFFLYNIYIKNILLIILFHFKHAFYDYRVDKSEYCIKYIKNTHDISSDKMHLNMVDLYVIITSITRVCFLFF